MQGLKLQRLGPIMVWALLSITMTHPMSSTASDCDFETFRDVMAKQQDAAFEAMVVRCGRSGRWPERDDGASLLHLAAHVGWRQAGAYTRRLLTAGLSPHTTTRDRHDPITPLGMAVRFNCAECVQALLATGADVRQRGPEGMSLLHEADADTVPLLIGAGLDPSARDDHGNAPLHRVWHPLLLVAGVNVVNHAGMTPLHAAAFADQLPRVEALLAAGADPSLRTTRATHWRAPHVSRAFGPGTPIAKGASALDLAREQQAATRFNIQSHGATVKRLEAVTPRRGWFER